MLQTLQSFFTQDASLWSLLAGSFLAATLIPLSSEVMLFAVIRLHPDLAWPAVVVATIGNTAGGMVSYAMGRWIPHQKPIQYEALLQRHGAKLLTMAWAPLIGDALCVAAGWLRLRWLPCLGFMALGKCLRYVVLTVLM